MIRWAIIGVVTVIWLMIALKISQVDEDKYQPGQIWSKCDKYNCLIVEIQRVENGQVHYRYLTKYGFIEKTKSIEHFDLIGWKESKYLD